MLYVKNTLIETAYFFEVFFFHAKYQGPALSGVVGALTSNILTAAILLTVITQFNKKTKDGVG
jgi:hypothetical protein